MIASYSQESSLSKAVTDTFSGEKPCSLCKKIQALESRGKKDSEPPATVTVKLYHDLFPPSSASLKDPFHSPFPCPAFAALADPVSMPASGPPAPPPRC